MLACAPAAADESVSFSKTMKMEVEQETTGCVASASFEYLQRGAEAEVEARIENDDCAASSGEFVVEAMIRADGIDEAEKLKFPETWSRDDDASIVLTRRYSIGDNVDLLRIRIRKLSCTCNVAAEEPASNP